MASAARSFGRTLDTPVSPLVNEACTVARTLLQGLDDGGARWRHTRAVASRTEQVTHLVGAAEAETLVAAAWLHDIGYTPALAVHHFHPVDGAHFALDLLGSTPVAGLIAQHSGARFIATARGLGALMHPFDQPEYRSGALADALTWADQTTGPTGTPVTIEQRLDEMLTRHGPDSPNARCHAQRAPALIAAVHATESRLHAAELLTLG